MKICINFNQIYQIRLFIIMKRQAYSRKYSKQIIPQVNIRKIQSYFKIISKQEKKDQKNKLKDQIKKQQINKQNLITNWLYKNINQSNQNNIWLKIDKPVMLLIFQYIPLTECAKISKVCRYFNKCYNSIWLNFNYFQRFDFSNFKSVELKVILEKSSRQAHILQMKKFFSGKSINHLYQKMYLKAIAVHEKGMFQVFEISPRKINTSLFIIDENLNEIFTRSYTTLKHLKLVSCPFLTSKTFVQISKFKLILSLTITKNNFILDSDVQLICKNCSQLQLINFSCCLNLTQNSLRYFRNLLSLKYLDLSFIDNNLSCINMLGILNLHQLILNYSSISTEQIISLLIFDKVAKLSLQGCGNIDENLISKISELKLKNLKSINLLRLNFQLNEQNLYNLVLNCKIKQLIVDSNYFSSRIVEYFSNKILFQENA